MKVDGKDCYDLNAIDSKTKYVLAESFVESRTLKACKSFLSQIKKTCYEQILEVYRKEKHNPVKKRKLITFVCDGFENYKSAFNKLFFSVAKLVSGVPIACRKYGLKHNNNAVERYNGDLKDRIKIIRGGFRSVARTATFMNLKRVMHNFVNPHQGLKGGTPAEAAEIKINLGRNKLLGLIHYLSKNKHLTKS